jgi:translin
MIPKIKEITTNIAGLQKRQDMVMSLSRDIVRLSGETIANLHAKRYKKVRSSIVRLGGMLAKLRRAERGFEYYSMQAHQEYVEAYLLYDLIKNRKLSSYIELKESPVNYLLGLMDTIGEMKRESFEELRAGNVENARYYYGVMQRVYDSTLHMRFANSILPNFRKKQDVARIQIESVASETFKFAHNL